MPSSYRDVPGASRTRYGREVYERGRALVERGLDLSHVIWDADEVLWDWAVSYPGVLSQIPLALAGRLRHREHVALRSGMLELVWGMRHAALERGLDAHMRIWTSGFAWRVWRIARAVDGFGELLGPPYARAVDAARMARHPRIVARMDFVALAKALLDPRTRSARLATMPEPARSVIARQLEERPDALGFKIPELALLMGKDAFAGARVLVDDTQSNVEWFRATHRSAVHVRNMVSGDDAAARPRHRAWAPERALARSAPGIALAIAYALDEIAQHLAIPTIAEALCDRDSDAPPNRLLTFAVPNFVLWREWIHPMHELRDAMREELG